MNTISYKKREIIREKFQAQKCAFSFTERIANKDLAVYVGVYKVTVSQRERNIQSYYGRFHAVLRKEKSG